VINGGVVVQDYTATGFLLGGKLHVRDRKAFDEAMSSWRDCEVTVTIAKKHATRSQQQSRYYFGVVLALIAEHTGYTVDELHDWAKAKFLPKHLALTDGNGVIVDEYILGGSTTKLNKVEFGEYVESIRRFAAETLDINIPDPDPDYWM
jgi:hypothetical protein